MMCRVLYPNLVQKKTTFFSGSKDKDKTFLSRIIVRFFHHYFTPLIQLSNRLDEKNQTLMGILSLKISELPDALSLECESLQPTTLYSNQKLLITH